jgi:flagellar biosynthetic protein FlhB
MLRDVPKADVVLANPTHVAVALRYRPKDMEAPQVVAKGAELVCEKIKEIARQHNIPVVEKPELARAVYAAVEVGQTIPETLFVAVAEVLAMVYRLRKPRRG